jgi:hypothetical protein
MSQVVLKSKTVEIPGIGEIEFREPLYHEVQNLLTPDNVKLGTELLILCTYQDNKKLFDSPVGMSTYMKLLPHVSECLEVCGMGDEVEKKD